MDGNRFKNHTGKLPTWIVLWLWFTSLICLWDATFLVLRPHTFPGGKYHTFWKPYSLYIEVDHNYKDMEDTFTYAQALCNYVEIAFNFVALYMNFANNKRTLQITFMVSVMTWWKTVIYCLQYLPFCDRGVFFQNTELTSLIFLFCIPNGIWILFPTFSIMTIWNKLFPDEDGRKDR